MVWLGSVGEGQGLQEHVLLNPPPNPPIKKSNVLEEN